MLLSSVLLSVATPCALAQTTEPPAPPAEPVPGAPSSSSLSSQITIKLDPMVWWVSPAGDLKLPAGAGVAGDSVQLSSLNLDTPQFSPAGAAALYADRFRFSFFGSGYSRDADGTADSSFQLGDVSVSSGDEFNADFELGFYELTAGYRLYRHDWKAESSDPANAADVAVDVYGLVGTRLYDLDIAFESGGARSGTDQFFGDLVAGARVEFTIIRDFSINVQASAGGMGDSDRSSFSFDIQLFGEWRPFSNVGLLFGWRHVQYSFEDGEGAAKFDYDGSIAGVFGGLTIRF